MFHTAVAIFVQSPAEILELVYQSLLISERNLHLYTLLYYLLIYFLSDIYNLIFSYIRIS